MKWFPTSLRRDPDDPRGLLERIDEQVRERIEEALDLFLLDLLGRLRRARGRPAPVQSNARDRREYEALARDLLLAIEAACGETGASPEPAAQAFEALLDRQVRYAKALPDYWQRFEAVTERFRTSRLEAAGRPSLLRRLFSR